MVRKQEKVSEGVHSARVQLQERLSGIAGCQGNGSVGVPNGSVGVPSGSGCSHCVAVWGFLAGELYW